MIRYVFNKLHILKILGCILLLLTGFILGVSSFRGEPTTVQDAVTQAIISQASTGVQERMPELVQWRDTGFEPQRPVEDTIQIQPEWSWMTVVTSFFNQYKTDSGNFDTDIMLDELNFVQGWKEEHFANVPQRAQQHLDSLTPQPVCRWVTYKKESGAFAQYIKCE